MTTISTAVFKPIRLKRRLGEGVNIELIFTPSSYNNNSNNNDNNNSNNNNIDTDSRILSSTSNDDIPTIRIPRQLPEQQDQDTDATSNDEYYDRYSHVDLVNFTGRLSFRRIDTTTTTTTMDDDFQDDEPAPNISSAVILSLAENGTNDMRQQQQDQDQELHMMSYSSLLDFHAETDSTNSTLEVYFPPPPPPPPPPNEGTKLERMSEWNENESLRFRPPSRFQENDLQRIAVPVDRTTSSLDRRVRTKSNGRTLGLGKVSFRNANGGGEITKDSVDTASGGQIINSTLPIRHRRNRRTSMFSIMKRESMKYGVGNSLMEQAHDETQGQTELHALVSSTDLTLAKLEELIEKDPQSVRITDAKGRLPLHALGSNSDLVNYAEGQVIAKQCAMVLMELYPGAMVAVDADGKMPFMYLIEKWVEWTHQQNEAIESPSSNQDTIGTVKGFFRRLWEANQHPIRGEEMVTETSRSARSLSDSSNHFPPVMIFEEVDWCFEMLSLEMEFLGGMPLDNSRNLRTHLSYKNQRSQRLALATYVALIPQLLKTTMLLDSNEIRQRIMESPVIHRTMLCPEAIGPWLTSMLRYNKGASSDMAIGFLTKLSQLSVDDYVGKYRKALPLDEELFKADKLKVFEAVESLRDIVPSLLILQPDRLDMALATPVIWFCVNRQMTNHFSMGMSSIDFQVQITTILAVRQALFLMVPGDGYSEVFPFLNIVSVVFFGCFLQVIQIICEAFALSRISSQVAVRYCRDPWRVLHFVGVFSAMWASIQYSSRIENGFYADERNIEEDAPPIVFACILGLLWISVIGFLKAVNESLATFILALIRIFFDIRFFCIVLLVFIVMFGDMFHVLYSQDPTLQAECLSEDLSDSAADFCSEKTINSYLRVYAMMIEDFSLSDFQQTSELVFLWFLVTFVGFVVMMNTLIAVINRSYESSHNSSILLFRRARCVFVASNAAIEGFLLPDFFQATSSRTCDFGSILMALARWFLLLIFFVTVSLSSLYLIQRSVESIENSNWLAMIADLILCVIMVFNVWSTIVFILDAALHMCCGEWSAKARNFVLSINQYFANKMAAKIFGIVDGGGELISVKTHGGRDKELHAKIDRLEKAFEQLLARKLVVEAEDIDHTPIARNDPEL